MKEVTITFKCKEFSPDSSIKAGDIVTYKGKVYIFEGWEFGEYAMGKNVETGEQEYL